MIKAWGRILLGDMIKNEQIQFFDSQVHVPIMLTPWEKLLKNFEIFETFSQPWCNIYVWEKLKKYSGEINPLGVHRDIRERILEVNSEGLGC